LPGSGHPIATLICGSRSVNRYVLTPREVLVFFGRLLLMAGCGALMGFWWLKRSVVEPLIQLTEQTDGKTSHNVRADRHTDRDDEIGDLARTLSEMHMSLEEWRDRAIRLERTVNQRVASETQRVSRELQQAKRTIWSDALTQLGNRRMLEDRLDDMFAAQREEGNDLSIVMLDVDNFKKLNDTKGHPAGDELLRFIGELLKHSLREQDLAIRYGGDEFILVLPAVAQSDAEKIAQRTILLFTQQVKLLSIEHKPSLSAGVASLWEHKVDTAKELMEVADQALLQAKRAGKSCVRTLKAQPRAPALAGSR
jgi:diguanylate cyclase (GGDEF)-like protein